MTQLDLITQRYDNVLLALPTLKKHQRRNKDGSIINIPDPEQGDRWTSLDNDLHQWIRELDQKEDQVVPLMLFVSALDSKEARMNIFRSHGWSWIRLKRPME